MDKRESQAATTSSSGIPRLPPPPPRESGAPPVPRTSVTPAEGRPSRTSTQNLLAAATSALKLRDEQLQARVQYYNKDMKTNAELDAITEQVVAELRAMGKVQAETKPSRPQQEIEIELIAALRGLLEKLFGGKRQVFVQRKVEIVQRRISQLFFNSELYARLAEGEKEHNAPAASWPEQALYFGLKQHEAAIVATLGEMPVASDDVRVRANEELQSFLKRLCTQFLSKTTPELERLLAIYREVLGHFFTKIFPGEVGDFAWEVIRESRVAVGHDLGYKITADKFHQFREVFDKKFLERLLLNVQDPISKRASAEAGAFREATQRFVADPHIHSEICTVINDSIYDYLHGEGYLDLPVDWKRLLAE